MISRKLLFFVVIINFNLALSTCPSKFFDCGNDRCIAQFWRCDGEDDCGNWADEQSCHNKESKQMVRKECAVNHTRCNDTHDACVSNKLLCDGINDCSNGADEMNCTTKHTNTTTTCLEFLCQNNECISLKMRCNGIPDCGDRSDELNCKQINTFSTETPITEPPTSPTPTTLTVTTLRSKTSPPTLQYYPLLYIKLPSPILSYLSSISQNVSNPLPLLPQLLLTSFTNTSDPQLS